MVYVMPGTSNGWDEWSKHVLMELERLNTCMMNIDNDLRKLSIEIAMLKVKAGVWGVIGGSIPAIVALAYFLIKSKPCLKINLCYNRYMKFTLQIKDITDLYNFYIKHPHTATYLNDSPQEQLRFNRALGLGLINAKGTLEQIKGEKILSNFRKKIELYKNGVPWSAYLLKHKKQCMSLQNIIVGLTTLPWARVTIKYKTDCITNTEAIIAGKLIRNKSSSNSMCVDKKRELSPNLDIYIRDVFDEWDDTWIEVMPHTFCWDILKKRELIWLTDRTQEIWIPLTHGKF